MKRALLAFLALACVAPAQTSITLSSSPNPSNLNQAVIFTAQASQFPNQPIFLMEGQTTLTQTTTGSTGSATFPAISNLSVGSHSIFAQIRFTSTGTVG